ncbi:hypothetical protein F5Y15DRAFT_389093 [Xylariaceae sp. FL0016]|nr:hypothetical protein F5Y15DRAFT_389093 [Xylariaceae sp. FL0016]
MASKAVIPFLVGMMLLTGVCNTLLTKFQDNQCVRDCDTKHPKHFEQPVLQTAQMFIGEAGCWLVVGAISLYKRFVSRRGNSPAADGYQPVAQDNQNIDGAADEGDTASIHSNTPLNGAAAEADNGRKSLLPGGVLSGFGVLLLALPAICDIIGTTLMNAGLLMVAASIYQMTRGALVLFVGLFSVVFLRRRLHLFQWLSLVGVVAGVALVGLSGVLWPDVKANTDPAGIKEGTGATVDAASTAIGVLLIAGAQIFTATQFVLEEYLLERSTIEPLEVVGWEGTFGFIVTLIGMVILHFAIGRTDEGRFGMFDMVEGLRQMTEYKLVLVSSLLIMVSIGGFNFFGLSVTRSVSATSRSTIDTCRTLFIWIVSLGLGWETFKWLQVAGFALLVYFTFLFNGIVQVPIKSLRPRQEVGELLPEDPIEHN